MTDVRDRPARKSASISRRTLLGRASDLMITGSLLAAAAWPGAARAAIRRRRLAYPPTRTTAATVTVEGMTFPDPYQWLEGSTPEVTQWQASQNKLATDEIRSWPDYDRLRDAIQPYLTGDLARSTGRIGLPRFIAGKWFRIEGGKAVMADEPFGPGHTVYDPKIAYPNRPAVIVWCAPSPDGRWLALGLCLDGSEHNSIRVVDLSGGKPTRALEPLILDAFMGACWLPDGSGFYYRALIGRPEEFRQHVLFYNIAKDAHDEVAIPLPDESDLTAREYMVFALSPDQSHIVLTHGLTASKPIAICDVRDATRTWRPFVRRGTANIVGFTVGDRLIALTDAGADRGRIVAIPLNAADPSDTARWQTLVPESSAVLRSITPVGGHLYILELHDSYAQVRIVDMTGKPVGMVPLPGKGAVDSGTYPIHDLVPVGHPDQYLFAFSTLTRAWGIYRHRPASDGLEQLQAPRIALEGAVIEDRWATSRDGTRVPYQMLRLAEQPTDRPQPTLLYAYGGLNAITAPQWPPGAIAAFVAMGGVYCVGHVRGDADLGRSWWEGGRFLNKHNSYHDIFAIAEDLIAAGRASRELLTMTGRSGGGQLTAVVALLRPDLWRAVVPQVLTADLIGGLRMPYHRFVTSIERAHPEQPSEIKRLTSFSPYHLVRKGVRYPAMFITAGAVDFRCPPWHSRKFAARLQADNGAGTPILLEILDNTGHGLANTREATVALEADRLAFLMQQLGMRVTETGKPAAHG